MHSWTQLRSRGDQRCSKLEAPTQIYWSVLLQIGGFSSDLEKISAVPNRKPQLRPIDQRCSKLEVFARIKRRSALFHKWKFLQGLLKLRTLELAGLTPFAHIHTATANIACEPLLKRSTTELLGFATGSVSSGAIVSDSCVWKKRELSLQHRL